MALLTRLFRRRSPPEDQQDAATPDAGHRILSLPTMPTAVYAVGDLHGCRQLYRALEAQIVADSAAAGLSGPKLIVSLGDVVDRGPDSAGLIGDLLGPAPQGFRRMVLRGNHEDKMADFLEDPDGHREWLMFGGDATLRSYGLRPEDDDRGFDLPAQRLTAMFRTAIPEDHRAFLRSLPLALKLDRYLLCHAGIDPARPIDQQDPDQLMWGDPSLVDATTGLPTIVHGHVIVEEPLVTPARINIDTGSYVTGRITAVCLTPDHTPRLLGVTGHPG
jgi:serine/threonine protein phosphatase 1